MKLDNIEVGQTIKSYRSMCEVLGQKIKTGNSKKAQLKEWDRYFSCDRSGNSFTITEIFNKPKDKDFRERKGIYSDIVQLLIMDLLSNNDGNIVITKEKLTKEIGLTNDNYSLGYRYQAKMSEYLEVDNVVLGDFYKVNTSSISKIIDNAIESLQRKFIIDKQDVLMIQYYSDHMPRVASPFDRELIQTINKEALVSLGLKEIDIKTRNNNYYKFKELRDHLIKQRTQIKYHYNAMDIVINRTFIANEMNELTYEIMNQLERKGKMKELNSLYANKVIEKAENRHNEVIENTISKDELTDLLLARFSDVYINTFHKMTNHLIKLDAPMINKSTFFDSHKSILSDSQIDDINENLPF